MELPRTGREAVERGAPDEAESNFPSAFLVEGEVKLEEGARRLLRQNGQVAIGGSRRWSRLQDGLAAGSTPASAPSLGWEMSLKRDVEVGRGLGAPMGRLEDGSKIRELVERRQAQGELSSRPRERVCTLPLPGQASTGSPVDEACSAEDA